MADAFGSLIETDFNDKVITTWISLSSNNPLSITPYLIPAAGELSSSIPSGEYLLRINDVGRLYRYIGNGLNNPLNSEFIVDENFETSMIKVGSDGVDLGSIVEDVAMDLFTGIRIIFEREIAVGSAFYFKVQTQWEWLQELAS